jgi:deferrochelatase/peroxidase EfeB
MATIDFTDMQGLVRFGHGRLKAAEFLLCEVTDAAAARAWLAAAPVTTAEHLETPPRTALQLAFTAAGLEALGLEPQVLAMFPQPFLAGMAGEDSRSRRLGDVGPNDPANWQWGRPAPHLLLMLYAEEGGLDAFKEEVLGAAFAAAFTVTHSLPTSTLRGREPFGFVDGISEPKIDWDQSFTTALHSRLDYANLLAPGEVVLGYANEYQEVTPRPLVGGEVPGADRLAEAQDAPGRRDLGLNGSYLVLRQLQQDVRGFWRFVDKAAGHDPERREALAAAMVGRHRDGTPLIRDERTVPGGRPGNNFTFDDDVDGQLCPVGAHIRRANPRTGDHPPGVQGFWAWLFSTLGFRRRQDGLKGRHDLVASTRFHRLVRRGREYGSILPVEEALGPGPDEAGAGEERGLHFICLCANLVRQFEFVQNAWIASARFDGLRGEADPLLGNRVPLEGDVATDAFSMPQVSGVTERVRGLPVFVTVKGGAYFFLPGIRALRFIASRSG